MLANSTYCFLFLIAVFLGMPQLALTQEDIKQRIDSTLQTLADKPYEEKKEAYHFINSIILKDHAGAEALFEYALSRDSTDLGRMVLYTRFSQKLSQKGLTDQALQIKLLGLELAEKLQDERATIEYHISVANAYLFQNLPDKALFHLNAAQPMAEKPENRDLLWNFYYHKGLLQDMLGDVEGQSAYYRKMGLLTDEAGNTPSNRFVLYILVDHFSQVDAPLELAKYTERLAAYYEEAHPNTPAGHMPIKSIFEKRTDPSNIPRLKEAITISDSLNSINSFAFNTMALADTYAKMGRPELAIPFLEEAIQKVTSVKKPQVLIYLYTKMAEINVAASNFKDAYNYKILEASLRDSISSERMQKNIAELEVKYDTEIKERKIAEQNLQIEKESRQKTQIFIGLIALGILLLVSFLFFRKRLKYQKTIAHQKETLQTQRITELQQKNKLLALSSMIEGQEAERLRIAKDLHDSLGGLLSTVKAHFSSIQREIEQLEQLNLTGKTNALIDEACLEVRRISHNMMPHALSLSGLKGAVEDMSEQLHQQGYEVTLEVSKLPEKMEPTREIMIYRLLQEIISNIRKHAEAKTILIQIIGYNGNVNIIVEDDGKGFDHQKAVENDGLGLKSINSRVQYLDGTINWDTQPGRGTSITINLPIV
ncbi:MAG: ATP-binding protein [Altibacter sp.]|nr:ATP-binding protein [Altibacter sp.]